MRKLDQASMTRIKIDDFWGLIRIKLINYDEQWKYFDLRRLFNEKYF